MPKWLKIVLIVFGCLAVLVGAIIGLAFWATSGPVKAVDDELALLHNGKIEEAYNATAKDFQNTITLDQFKAYLDAYPSFKNNKSVSWSSREINNDQGKLDGELKAADGGVTPLEVVLIKENDVWRVLSFEVKKSGATSTEQ